MKKLTQILALIIIVAATGFAPVEHGVYAELTGKQKFIVQIVADKTYENVVVLTSIPPTTRE